MNFKKHIMIGMATGLVGMALISGGTVAYFSDDIVTENQIMSGTINLGIKNTSDKEGFHFNFKNKQPGDVFEPYTFELVNDGTLKIGELLLVSEYKSTDKNGDSNDFGKQIRIQELKVNGVVNEQLSGKTIHQIDSEINKELSPAQLITDLEPNKKVKVEVVYQFIKEKGDQNKYQGNTLNLKWTFEAKQALEQKK